jgi:hypothetical protein
MIGIDVRAAKFKAAGWGFGTSVGIATVLW